MSWIADVAFDDFARQFDSSYASAHQFRQRHLTATVTGAFQDLARGLLR